MWSLFAESWFSIWDLVIIIDVLEFIKKLWSIFIPSKRLHERQNFSEVIDDVANRLIVLNVKCYIIS